MNSRHFITHHDYHSDSVYLQLIDPLSLLCVRSFKQGTAATCFDYGIFDAVFPQYPAILFEKTDSVPVIIINTYGCSNNHIVNKYSQIYECKSVFGNIAFS